MFENITKSMQQRMQELEARDNFEQSQALANISTDVNQKTVKLHQISPDTGRFISLIAASSPKGQFIEIGTSAGYSTLWLSLACKKLNTTITTFELNAEKIKLATETFSTTNTEQYINLQQGNVLDYLEDYQNISFCFLDAEKKIYAKCFDIVVNNMVPGAFLVADNVISHNRFLKDMLKQVFADQRMDSVIVPIGKGILMSKKID